MRVFVLATSEWKQPGYPRDSIFNGPGGSLEGSMSSVHMIISGKSRRSVFGDVVLLEPVRSRLRVATETWVVGRMIIYQISRNTLQYLAMRACVRAYS